MNKRNLKLAGTVTGKVVWEGVKAVALTAVVNYALMRITKGKKATSEVKAEKWVEML